MYIEPGTSLVMNIYLVNRQEQDPRSQSLREGGHQIARRTTLQATQVQREVKTCTSGLAVQVRVDTSSSETFTKVTVAQGNDHGSSNSTVICAAVATWEQLMNSGEQRFGELTYSTQPPLDNSLPSSQMRQVPSR